LQWTIESLDEVWDMGLGTALRSTEPFERGKFECEEGIVKATEDIEWVYCNRQKKGRICVVFLNNFSCHLLLSLCNAMPLPSNCRCLAVKDDKTETLL
jgi:hypothetical protein